MCIRSDYSSWVTQEISTCQCVRVKVELYDNRGCHSKGCIVLQ